MKSGDSETSFFDGVDTSLLGIASLAHGDAGFLRQGLTTINRDVEQATAAYDPAAPAKIAPALHDGYLATEKLIGEVKSSSLSEDDKANIDWELEHKLGQFNTALADALGLQIDALTTPGKSVNQATIFSSGVEDTRAAATPGSDVFIRLHLLNVYASQPKGAPRLVKTWVVSPVNAASNIEQLAEPKTDAVTSDALFRVAIAADAHGTRPYFSRPSTEQAYYDIDDARWLNDSFEPYPLEGWAEFDYDGVPIQIGQVVQTVHRAEGIGSVENPLVIAPGISVGIHPSAGAVPLGRSEFSLSVTVHSNLTGTAEGTVSLTLPSGWKSDPVQAAFHLKSGEDKEVSFRVQPDNLEAKSYEIKAVATSGGHDYTDGYQTVGYPELLRL